MIGVFALYEISISMMINQHSTVQSRSDAGAQWQADARVREWTILRGGVLLVSFRF